MISKRFSFLLAIIIAVFAVNVFADSPVVIKIATIAPEGSVWITELKALNDEIMKATDDQVKFKIFPGGVMGEDEVVLRKIRVGQLDGACFTTNGLSLIDPKFRALNLPGIFQSSQEIDFLLEKMSGEFDGMFRQNGYESLGITGLGFTYMFTNIGIPDASALRKTKPWLWENDLIMTALYKAAEVNPISVGLSDVLTALETGMIDTVFNTPAGILALQWFTKVKSMIDLPLTYAFGAFIVSSKTWAKLPADRQELVSSIVKKHMLSITEEIRVEDKKALEIISTRGVTIVQPSAALKADFNKITQKAREDLIQKNVDAPMVEKIEKVVQEYRQGITQKQQ
jgi:TRAP-type transport system periplasmic protein